MTRHFAIAITFTPRAHVAHLLPRKAEQEFSIFATSKVEAIRAVAVKIAAAKIVEDITAISVKSLRD